MRARRPQPRPANSCMRRSERFAAASTGHDRRSRRLRSACPRRGEPAWRSALRGKAKPRQGPAEAPNTRMRQGKASGSLAAGHASRALCRAPSSANHTGRRRALRSRSRRGAPPRAALPPLVPPRPGRQRGPKAQRAAPPQPRRRLGQEHVAADSDRRLGLGDWWRQFFSRIRVHVLMPAREAFIIDRAKYSSGVGVAETLNSHCSGTSAAEHVRECDPREIISRFHQTPPASPRAS